MYTYYVFINFGGGPGNPGTARPRPPRISSNGSGKPLFSEIGMGDRLATLKGVQDETLSINQQYLLSGIHDVCERSTCRILLRTQALNADYSDATCNTSRLQSTQGNMLNDFTTLSTQLLLAVRILHHPPSSETG